MVMVLLLVTPRLCASVDSLQNRIEQYQQQDNMDGLARTYLALGEEYLSRFDHNRALQVLKAGLDAAEESQNMELEFRILDNIGRTYSWMDDYRHAIEYHWQANELADQGIPEEYLAKNLAHIGDTYLILGNLRQALDYQLQAKEINEMILDTLGLAAAYDKIGRIYWQMQRYESSLENLKEALDIYTQAGLDVYIYQMRAAMAQVYMDMGRLDRAMEEADASLAIAQKAGYQYGIANSTGMIGAILEQENQLRDAEDHLQEAINQFDLAGIRYELAEYTTTLARVRRKTNRLSEAGALLVDALDMARDIQSLALKTRIYRELARVYEASGDFRQAFSYLSEYESRKDSMLNVDNLKQVAYLETDYELQKRERQIELLESESQQAQTRFLVLAISGSLIMLGLILWLTYARYRSQLKTSRLLRGKNDEIQRQNEALSASNAELRRFSDLAASDLRSPLEGVREEIERLNHEYPDIQEAEAMSRDLDHLGQLDALLAGISAFAVVKQEEKDWTSLNLGDIVKEAIRSLPEQERKKATRIQIQQLPEVRGDRRQLVQLFQHLVSNAIRFQAKEEPEVIVSARSLDHFVVVTVKDNGEGIPLHERERVFDLFYQGKNADETAGSGVGLAVSRRIVQQHGGKIWVDPVQNQGASVSFTIPRSENG